MALNTDFTQGALGQFQAGAGLGGQHALAPLVRTIMERVNQIQNVQLEHQLRTQYDPEYRLKSKLFGIAEQQLGQPGTAGIGTDELMRSFLGLPKSPTRLAAEAQAQEAGKLAANPAEVELKKQQTRKLKQDIAKTSGGLFGRLKGVTVPGEERIRVRKKATGEIGTIIGTDFDPAQYEPL